VSCGRHHRAWLPVRGGASRRWQRGSAMSASGWTNCRPETWRCARASRSATPACARPGRAPTPRQIARSGCSPWRTGPTSAFPPRLPCSACHRSRRSRRWNCSSMAICCNPLRRAGTGSTTCCGYTPASRPGQ
jgi:hypothetical protein